MSKKKDDPAGLREYWYDTKPFRSKAELVRTTTNSLNVIISILIALRVFQII